jgi:hypothetical protein
MHYCRKDCNNSNGSWNIHHTKLGKTRTNYGRFTALRASGTKLQKKT